MVNLPTLIVLIISAAVTILSVVSLVAWFVFSTYGGIPIECVCSETECPSGCTACSTSTVCTTCATGYAKKPDNTACLREFSFDFILTLDV